ncbi:hypothetical protein ACFQY5_37135 [Paeniroseomonas aquatica]|uniref:hypothetical protein n=1 Tax=Paeniroseomonas aquatica TaxID=373043 RepID=UPI00361B280C
MPTEPIAPAPPGAAAITLAGVGYAPPGHPPILAGIDWTVPAGPSTRYWAAAAAARPRC